MAPPRCGVALLLLVLCGCFLALLQPAASPVSESGRSLPAADSSVSGCCEGDLLFLVDSSGSVSSYEFSKVREFLGSLLRPFSIGPEEVQVSVLQVSTQPTPEFGFSAHSSGESLQEALAGMRQLHGDTNTGAALGWARERAFGRGTGAREGVPRVLVWVTDGVSSDSVLQPMRELREEGVAVLIVSTGHGNYPELSAAASPPTDRHLHFVDVDAFDVITEELRGAIIDIIRAQRLSAVEVTSRSARLLWPALLSAGSGFYVLRFGPSQLDPAQHRSVTLPGSARSAPLTGLHPQTSYTATLTPESNLQYTAPLTVSFSTLPEEPLSPARILISDSCPTSVRVSWGPVLPDSVEEFQVLFGPLPSGEARSVTVSRNQNSTLLQNLRPNTTYLVTVTAQYHSGRQRALSAKACTLEASLPQGNAS